MRTHQMKLNFALEHDSCIVSIQVNSGDSSQIFSVF